MARDYFQDVTPPQQRSIRNIPVDRVERPMRDPVRTYTGEMPPTPPERPVEQRAGGQPRPPMPPMRKKRGSPSWIYWLLALCIISLVVAGVVFASWNTKVTVTPRTQTVVFDEQSSFTAYPEGSQEALSGSLSYTILERTIEESIVAEASGSAQAEDEAFGNVTIYNDYSDTPQRLIKNTRFETSDGRVYRIRESVVIPGKQEGKPGTLTATIYADEPGERYNISGAAAFTLPGLKSSAPDMFEKIYARTDTGVSGGFVGERPVVAEAALSAAQTTLRAALQARARELASSEVPDGSVAFPDGMLVSFTSLPPEKKEDGSVSVKEQAVVRMPVFNTAAFARTVGASTVADAETAVVMIKDPTTVTARLVTAPEELGAGALDIALSGRATLVWQVDAGAFAQDLSGRDKDATQTVLAGYPGIVNAVVSLRPFWRTSFPADAADIQVAIEEPKE